MVGFGPADVGSNPTRATSANVSSLDAIKLQCAYSRGVNNWAYLRRHDEDCSYRGRSNG